jgi:tetratricopeptide (TPR) repeat protein
MAHKLLGEVELTQQINHLLKSYHSALALARSPLANSLLVTPLLVLDDVSPTADERGQALRLVVQWAVNRLAPGETAYPLGVYRPYDDPTWRDPHWWRYNILRHRYLEPIHPDEFVEGGRTTETLIALTGIPSTDTFFDERNRAIREVTERLRHQLTSGAANEELRQLAIEEVLRPLQNQPEKRALLGIAATFDDVFPRALLLRLAAFEQLAEPEEALDYLTTQRLLLMGDGGRNLWLSPALKQHIYARQPTAQLRLRHQRVADHYATENESLKAARHLQRANQWEQAVALLFAAAPELANELQVQELCEVLQEFRSTELLPATWREVQILLSDLYSKSGQHEQAIAACRQALRASHSVLDQARIYRRMGKLYEKHNQLHALGYYQQALERLPTTDPELLELLKDRAWLYILRQEWDKAEADLTVALQRTPESAQEVQANIFDAFAQLFSGQKQYQAAIEYAHKALALREQIGDLARVANSFVNLGLIYNEVREFRHAIKAQQDALAIYQRLGNQPLVATALLNIGMAEHLDHRLLDAIRYYTQSLDLCQEIGLPFVEVRAHANLAEAWAELGQGEEARRHWLAGYQLSQNAGFDDEIAALEDLRQQIFGLQQAHQPDATSLMALNTEASYLEPDMRRVLKLVKQDGQITSKRLMEALHISKATATRRLAQLVERELLQPHGKGRGVYYVLAQAHRAAGQASGPAPQLADSLAHQLEQIAAALQPEKEELARDFAVANLGIVYPISNVNNGAFTLLVRFACLPDLFCFFSLENQLAVWLNQPVDVKPVEVLTPTDLARLEGQVCWLW